MLNLAADWFSKKKDEKRNIVPGSTDPNLNPCIYKRIAVVTTVHERVQSLAADEDDGGDG